MFVLENKLLSRSKLGGWLRRVLGLEAMATSYEISQLCPLSFCTASEYLTLTRHKKLKSASNLSIEDNIYI